MRFFRGRLAAVLVFVFIFLFPCRLHAGTGIGVEGGVALPLKDVNGMPTLLAVTFKTDKVPLIISGRLQLNGTQLSGGGLIADLWLDEIQVGYSIFDFYYGIGASFLYHNEVGGDDDTDDDSFSQATGIFVAPRVFAGISTMLTSCMELYTQAAAEPGIVFDEADGFIFRIQMPLSVGLRFWF